MNSILINISDYDISFLRLIHHNRIKDIDNLLYLISFTTTFVSITLLIIILFVSIKLKSSELQNKFFKVLAILIISATLSLTLKSLIFRERPFITYPDIEQISEAGSSSFPSGHSLEAFAMALAISMLFPKKKIIIPVFVWASLVAYSRIALGVHYPSDILAGIILGLLISYLTLVLYNYLEWKRKKT